MCAIRLFWLELDVNAAGTVLERAAGASRAAGEDLREDGDGDLGRRVGADVETRRARDAVDRVYLHAGFQEPLAPALLVSAGAEGTDVESIGLERTNER